MLTLALSFRAQIVGAALKAAGIPATEENLERVLGLQFAEDIDVARCRKGTCKYCIGTE